MQHESRLLLAIESKLFEAASDWQSLDINTSQITAQTERRIHVRWSDLLERWWSLIESGVLSATEQQILSEFADFTEEHFSWLLPSRRSSAAAPTSAADSDGFEACSPRPPIRP